MKAICSFLIIVVHLLCFAVNSYGEAVSGKKNLQISGAGPSTEVVKLLAREFSKAYPQYEITVPLKSIKHRGGIAWGTRLGQLFGRLGRPLSVDEKKDFPSAREIPIAKIQLGFAVNVNLGIKEISLSQLEKIYTGAVTNWQELGGPDQPIIVLGREQGEASLTHLQKDYSFFQQNNFHKIYNKDHLLSRAIVHVPGAIGFASKSSLSTLENVVVLEIDGFHSGQQVGLVYDVKNENHEAVQLMKSFVTSDTWRRALLGHDIIPLDK